MKAKHNLFLCDDILNAIDRLNIEVTFFGGVKPACPLIFCSLRSPQEGGVYFLSGDIEIPTKIKNSIFITDAKSKGAEANFIIQVEKPQEVFYQLMNYFFESRNEAGIHETAVVHPEAEVADTAYIGPYCVIGKAIISDGVFLHSHVVVFDGSDIQANVTIEPHSTIGATGVAWIRSSNGERIRQPQIGGVIVKENSFLGSDITIVRGSVNESTIIGKNCVIAHGSKIGHGSEIGDEVHFANNISIAGNVVIGDFCFLGAASVVRPRVVIASHTTVAAGCVVVKDVEEEGGLVVGVPGKLKSKPDQMSGVPKNH